MRDARYRIVSLRFKEGKITNFRDITDIVPKTVLASDLGKNNDRFSELADHTEKFTLKELVLIARFCGLTLPDILTIISADHIHKKRKEPKSKDVRYEYVKDMFTTGHLSSFVQIFQLVPRYVVAPDLGMKRDRLGKLIRQMETFIIKDLIAIGWFCQLQVQEIFSLVAADHASRINKKISNKS